MNNLTQFSINGITPFYSPSDTTDEVLCQAHALATLISSAHQVCDKTGHDSADAFVNLREGIKARAMDGVATLIALAQSQIDVVQKDRQDRAQMPRSWTSLVETLAQAQIALDAHEGDAQGLTCGTPENDAYEAETDRLAGEQAKAFDDLMLAPAPNATALAYKLETFARFAGDGLWHKTKEIADQLASDARRLCGA